MKSNFSGYFIVWFLIASCANNKSNNTENVASQTEESKKNSPPDCYRYANTTDTIILKLIHIGESITGTLVYKLHEKDKNTGTIQGSMRGDILLADYTFMSEGVVSIRQIAFKKEKEFFIEGHGDINTNNERVFFKNPDSLQFNDVIKLTEIDCQK
jgi:hypothetical protein